MVLKGSNVNILELKKDVVDHSFNISGEIYEYEYLLEINYNENLYEFSVITNSNINSINDDSIIIFIYNSNLVKSYILQRYIL